MSSQPSAEEPRGMNILLLVNSEVIKSQLYCFNQSRVCVIVGSIHSVNFFLLVGLISSEPESPLPTM